MRNVLRSRSSNVSSRFARPAFVIVAAVAILGSAHVARAQQQPVVTTLRLASPQTPPGGETFVTLMLANVPTERVQVLHTEIEYQTNHLTYVAARPGFAADLAGATIDVKVEQVESAGPPPGSPPGTPPRPRTRIAITMKGKKPIPNGPVAELRFKVGPAFTATHEGVTETDPSRPAAPKPPAEPPKPPTTPVPGTVPADAQQTLRTVIIRVANRATATAPQGTEVPLIAEAGEVRVTTERKGKVPVVFACFFYMH